MGWLKFDSSRGLNLLNTILGRPDLAVLSSGLRVRCTMRVRMGRSAVQRKTSRRRWIPDVVLATKRCNRSLRVGKDISLKRIECS